MFDSLLLGMSSVLTLQNLWVCAFGALIGTAVGVLPGVGPTAAAAILSPLILTSTLTLEQCGILLTSILYGSQYGGSTGAILMGIPGENSSAITAIEGNALAKRGMAKPALAAAAIASFIGGIVAMLFVAFIISSSMGVLKLSPVSQITLMLLALFLFLLFSKDPPFKGIVALVLGFAISVFIGEGSRRSGVEIGILAIALFGVSGAALSLLKGEERPERASGNEESENFGLLSIFWPALRGSIVGLLGVIPGLGFLFVSTAAYNVEKAISKNRDKFGSGAIEGVAAPEAANNSAAQCVLISLLALGIPGGALMAMFVSMMTTNGIEVGPQLSTTHPGLVWSIIASMLVVNFFLLVLNWPLAQVWARLFDLSSHVLSAIILILGVISIAFLSASIYGFVIGVSLCLAGIGLRVWGFNVATVFMGCVFGGLIGKLLLKL